MRITIFCTLALGIFVACGCSSEPQKSLVEEKKALKGGPMPPGTWDKIAERKKAFDAQNGNGASGTPAAH